MNILIGIIGLGIIIFIHEMGHYIAARMSKVIVLEFAIGMGPKIYSFIHANTQYSIRLLPLGGFCKLKSPDMEALKTNPHQEIPQEEGTLASVSYIKKIFILFAGPLANIIWYLGLSFVLFLSHYKTQELPPSIEPIKDLPAYVAGLQQGDTITYFADTEIKSFSQLANLAKKYKGENVEIQYIRNNTAKSITVQLNNTNPILGVYPYVSPKIIKNSTENNPNAFWNGDIILDVAGTTITNAIYFSQELEKHKGKSVTITVLRNNKKIPLLFTLSLEDPFVQLSKAQNFHFEIVTIEQWSNFSQFIKSRISQISNVFISTVQILTQLLRFETKQISQQTMGPLRIISFVGNDTISNIKNSGIFFALLQFIRISALLSLAIAVMNLIPIPVLDGGQIAFYSYFAIRKKQPTFRAMHYYQVAGAIIMLIIFALVMFGDISHIIKSLI